MVYYHTTEELELAYGHMVGLYDYLDIVQHPDSETALELANLTPGESVLDVGAGSGRFIASAKQQVGAGFCLAVDAVQGFLNMDIPWAVRQKGFTVHPAGDADQQVHLLQANITDGGLASAISRVPGVPAQFDCIVALHVFTTIPAHLRRPALVALHQLLKPATGRLIVNLSARFTNLAPKPTEVNVPVQFRTTGHTECPGSQMLKVVLAGHPAVPNPSGRQGLVRRQVAQTVQVAPDRAWAVAAVQAEHAAGDAGFVVNQVRDIGKGDTFGLPAGLRSPPAQAIAAMSNAQRLQAANNIATAAGYNCCGRIRERMALSATSAAATPEARDYTLVAGLQAMYLEDARQFATGAMEASQVGVLLVLGK